jgi:hypothetical protein
MDLIISIVQIAVHVIAIASIASIVSALTPNVKDDEWVAKVKKYIDLLALNLKK